MKTELTQELLKELLHYCPDTGIFTWRERPLSMFKSERDYNWWNGRYSNKKAGCIAKNKNRTIWITITIFQQYYQAHHLSYFYMTGNLTKEDIDCIDGDFTNLKWNNIRACTRSDTLYKQIIPQGKNKLIGYYFNKKSGKYQSSIRRGDKRIHLGQFNTPEEAHQAYVNAKRQISPEFSML